MPVTISISVEVFPKLFSMGLTMKIDYDAIDTPPPPKKEIQEKIFYVFIIIEVLCF